MTETTLAGLRDAGVLAPRFAGLDAVLATKAEGATPGVQIDFPQAATIARRRPPGSPHLDVRTAVVPRPGVRAAKRAWRATIAQGWSDRAPLEGEVFADVSLDVSGSLLGALEVALDALEPVLGRDPRGRAWQEFFPNDHTIQWLRVRRGGPAPLRLRLGPISST